MTCHLIRDAEVKLGIEEGALTAHGITADNQCSMLILPKDRQAPGRNVQVSDLESAVSEGDNSLVVKFRISRTSSGRVTLPSVSSGQEASYTLQADDASRLPAAPTPVAETTLREPRTMQSMLLEEFRNNPDLAQNWSELEARWNNSRCNMSISIEKAKTELESKLVHLSNATSKEWNKHPELSETWSRLLDFRHTALVQTVLADRQSKQRLVEVLGTEAVDAIAERAEPTCETSRDGFVGSRYFSDGEAELIADIASVNFNPSSTSRISWPDAETREQKYAIPAADLAEWFTLTSDDRRGMSLRYFGDGQFKLDWNAHPAPGDTRTEVFRSIYFTKDNQFEVAEGAYEVVPSSRLGGGKELKSISDAVLGQFPTLRSAVGVAQTTSTPIPVE